MSTHAGDIYFDITGNDRPLKKTLGGLDGYASKIGAGIGKKLAAGLSVAAFGKFIKDATKAGASLNAMNTIVDAALPNMTKQVDTFAKHAGAMFGLSETQAKGFVGKFASMASAMGFTEKQAYTMSTALTGLAGDVASYYHISQDEAYAKLGAVFTGETESLKSLGVIMTQSALDAFALANGFGKVTSQMTETEKTSLRYAFVLDSLKLAAGDFAKYANTWSGSIATIRLNWSNFMATVGQGIINILLPLLQLIARISNALTALGARFLSWTKKVRGIKEPIQQAFGKKTQSDLKKSAGGLGNIGSGLGGTGKAAKGAKKQVQALKKELLGFDQITKLTGEQGTTAGGGTTGGVGGGGISAGGIDFSEADADTASFSERAKDYLSKIKLPPALEVALKDLKEAFSGLFEVLEKAGKWALQNVLKPLGEWTINELAPASVETLAKGITLLKTILEALGKVFGMLWEPVIKPFFQFLGDVAIGTIKRLGDIFVWLTQFITGLTNTFSTLNTKVTETVNSIKAKWEDLKSNIKDILPKLSVTLPNWEDIKAKWNDLKNSIKDILPKLTVTLPNWQDIKNKWTDLKNTIKDITKKVSIDTPSWGSIKSSWNSLLGNFKDKSVDIKLSLPSWKNIKSKWNDLMSKFKDKTVTIKQVLQSAVSGAKKKKKKADGGIYKNGRWSPIQRYAEGGLPNGSQLFWARENGPELVGTLGGHTAVMNNDQIVASVSSGVAKAIMGVRLKATLPPIKAVSATPTRNETTTATDNAELITLVKQLITTVQSLDLDVELDGEKIKKNTVRRINNHTRATGKLELII